MSQGVLSVRNSSKMTVLWVGLALGGPGFHGQAAKNILASIHQLNVLCEVMLPLKTLIPHLYIGKKHCTKAPGLVKIAKYMNSCSYSSGIKLLVQKNKYGALFCYICLFYF